MDDFQEINATNNTRKYIKFLRGETSLQLFNDEKLRY